MNKKKISTNQRYKYIWEIFYISFYVIIFLPVYFFFEDFLYIEIIGTLAVIVIFICLAPSLTNFRKNNELITRWLITISATCIGVFLAVTINDYEKRHNDKIIFISSLTNTKTNVMVCRGIWGEFLKSYYLDINKADSSFSLNIVRGNPAPFPDQFYTLMENERTLTFISNPTLRVLSKAKWELPNIKRILDTRITIDSLYFNSVIYYHKKLGLVRDVLGIEVQYQRSEISMDKLIDTLNYLDEHSLPDE